MLWLRVVCCCVGLSGLGGSGGSCPLHLVGGGVLGGDTNSKHSS